MTSQQWVDLVKWLGGGFAGALVVVVGLIWREAKRRGAEDERMKVVLAAIGTIDKIEDMVDRLSQKLDQLVDSHDEVRKRVVSDHPKKLIELDKRVSRAEWELHIEPTSKMSIVPPGPRNGER